MSAVRTSILSKYERWVFMDQSKPDASTRLFCFPYAGAGASVFREWQKLLPREIDAIAIQLPGRENRFCEPRLNRLDDVTGCLCKVIPGLADRPFFFFGHSVGALIAFELARSLRDRRLPSPFHVVVSGTRAPHIAAREEALHKLENDAFIEKIRAFNGTPPTLINNADLMDLYIPILRDDIAISETYRIKTGRTLDCDMTALGGDADPDMSIEDIRAWRAHTTGRFSSRLLPGDHFFLHPNQAKILDILAAIAGRQENLPVCLSRCSKES